MAANCKGELAYAVDLRGVLFLDCSPTSRSTGVCLLDEIINDQNFLSMVIRGDET